MKYAFVTIIVLCSYHLIRSVFHHIQADIGRCSSCNRLCKFHHSNTILLEIRTFPLDNACSQIKEKSFGQKHPVEKNVGR